MKSAVAIVVVFLCASASVPAQTGTDPGARDSVWIESVIWNGDNDFATAIHVESDDSLKHATIVLTWGTTEIQIDSVSVSGSRWGSVVSGDSGMVISAPGQVGGVPTGMHQNISFLPFTRLLAPGLGPVGVIHWSRTGGLVAGPEITVDSSTTTSGAMTVNSLLFGFSSQPEDNYTPAFGAGTVTVVPCDCPWQGDLNESGVINATDLTLLIEAIFFGGSSPKDPDCPRARGNVNCDGVVNATDLTLLINHIFFGGAGPCDPCAL